MTAYEYREYALVCDADGCKVAYGPFGVERPRAELRKLAAGDGWTTVTGHRTPTYYDDFCPAHKPSPDRGERYSTPAPPAAEGGAR